MASQLAGTMGLPEEAVAFEKDMRELMAISPPDGSQISLDTVEIQTHINFEASQRGVTLHPAFVGDDLVFVRTFWNAYIGDPALTVLIHRYFATRLQAPDVLAVIHDPKQVAAWVKKFPKGAGTGRDGARPELVVVMDSLEEGFEEIKPDHMREEMDSSLVELDAYQSSLSTTVSWADRAGVHMNEVDVWAHPDGRIYFLDFDYVRWEPVSKTLRPPEIENHHLRSVLATIVAEGE